MPYQSYSDKDMANITFATIGVLVFISVLFGIMIFFQKSGTQIAGAGPQPTSNI